MRTLALPRCLRTEASAALTAVAIPVLEGLASGTSRSSGGLYDAIVADSERFVMAEGREETTTEALAAA
jgi:hypothetical protein